jgi:hypothetical protein
VPDELLTIFKICFLVLLYLFFFRVLRAVWSEVTSAPAAGAPTEPPRLGRRRREVATVSGGALATTAAPGPAPAQAPTGPTRLVALEPPHLAGLEYALVDDLTLGRSPEADVIIDDSFLSQRHASFEFRSGSWIVADLGSTNGTFLNGARLDQPARLASGDRVKLGNLVLEVR